MLAHKTWDENDWQVTDNEDRKGGIVEEKDKEIRERQTERNK